MKNIFFIDTEPASSKLILIKSNDKWPKYILEENECITDYIIKYGSWELELIELAMQDIKPNSVFLDIGANIGTWTVMIGRIMRDKVKIHAFEPQKNIYYQLCGNVFINNLSNNVNIHNTALGSELFDNMPMYKCENNNGASRLVNSINSQIFKLDDNESVTINTLDSYNFNNISVIKMDVEGYEKNVLLGAKQTIINNNYPIIYFECWDRKEYQQQRQELFTTLNEIGYNKIELIKDGDYRAEKI